MRACRDGDTATLKLLIDQAALFEKPNELREACLSGAWGAPNGQLYEETQPSYTTQDSILLHNLLLTATTRSYANIVELLLEKFPARRLHEAEWELVLAALGTGKVEVVKAYVKVDPELVNMMSTSFGNCFDIVLALVDDPEDWVSLIEFLLEQGGDPSSGFGDHAVAHAEKHLPEDLMLNISCATGSSK
jgi:hypothetical protein